MPERPIWSRPAKGGFLDEPFIPISRIKGAIIDELRARLQDAR